MIAMASQSGPILSHLIGSVTRQVIRQTPCPTWILHPRDKAESSQHDEPSALIQGRVIL